MKKETKDEAQEALSRGQGRENPGGRTGGGEPGAGGRRAGHHYFRVNLV